jgi:carbamate kinase
MSRSGRLAVVAVGGNALISDPSHVALEDQADRAASTADQIADLLVDGWSLLLTHGNGPQVGFVLHRSAIARGTVPEVPLLYAVADTQGALGYMLQEGLALALRRRSTEREVTAVVTRVAVCRDDPAFQVPTKPVGAHLSREEAELLAERFGWSIAEDSGRGWRRVVPSPRPRTILDLDAIEKLLLAGHVVIAGGGGGIPVVDDGDGYRGIDAVIDKDATSCLLAQLLGAEAFVILTDVEQAVLNYRQNDEEPLGEISVVDAERYMAEGHFGAGSMGPKIDAAIDFARSRPGGRGIITNIESVATALSARKGTHIVN